MKRRAAYRLASCGLLGVILVVGIAFGPKGLLIGGVVLLLLGVWGCSMEQTNYPFDHGLTRDEILDSEVGSDLAEVAAKLKDRS